jgi:hypothetical protein
LLEKSTDGVNPAMEVGRGAALYVDQAAF